MESCHPHRKASSVVSDNILKPEVPEFLGNMAQKATEPSSRSPEPTKLLALPVRAFHIPSVSFQGGATAAALLRMLCSFSDARARRYQPFEDRPVNIYVTSGRSEPFKGSLKEAKGRWVRNASISCTSTRFQCPKHSRHPPSLRHRGKIGIPS